MKSKKVVSYSVQGIRLIKLKFCLMFSGTSTTEIPFYAHTIQLETSVQIDIIIMFGKNQKELKI